MRYAIVLFLFFAHLTLFAQDSNLGKLKGITLENATQFELMGVNIYIQGQQTIKEQSTLDGRFEIELPEGAYTLTFEQEGYQKWQTQVEIKAGEEQLVNVSLKYAHKGQKQEIQISTPSLNSVSL